MKRWILIGAALLFVFGSWGYTYQSASKVWNKEDKTVAQHGVFGDSFGSINALFSGLAFLGVVVALVIQSGESKRQQQEFLLQSKISASAAIIEAEKTLAEYYTQAIQNNAPSPVPAEPRVTWADFLQKSRERVLEMSKELVQLHKQLKEVQAEPAAKPEPAHA